MMGGVWSLIYCVSYADDSGAYRPLRAQIKQNSRSNKIGVHFLRIYLTFDYTLDALGLLL